MHIPQHPDSESAFSLLSKHETTNYHKKQTGQFFQNNTLYCDVKDNMLEQKVPEKKCTISVTMVEQVKNITDKKKKKDMHFIHYVNLELFVSEPQWS